MKTPLLFLSLCLTFFCVTAQQLTSDIPLTPEHWSQSMGNDASEYIYFGKKNKQQLEKNAEVAEYRLIAQRYDVWDTTATAWIVRDSFHRVYNELEQLERQFSYSYDETGALQNSYRYQYDYNATGNRIYDITQILDGNNWLDNQRNFYEYNADGIQTLALNQRWINSTNSWQTNNSFAETYDERGNRLSRIFRYWSSQNDNLTNGYKQTYTYNGNDQVLTYVIQLGDDWSGIFPVNDSMWNNANRTEYQYDSQQNNYLSDNYSWDRDNNTWLTTGRTLQTFDATGRNVQRLNQDWRNNSWANDSRNTYTYFGETDLYLSTQSETWDGEQWIVTRSIIFQRDEAGNLISYLSEGYDIEQPEIRSFAQEITYTYDDVGNRLSRKAREWNVENGAWANIIQYRYYYEAIPNIHLPEDTLIVNSSAGEIAFEVCGTTDWSIIENTNWLSVDPTGGSNQDSVTISYQSNLSTSDRTAQLIVRGVGLEDQTITLIQRGLSNNNSDQPDWEISPTGVNHTIIIPANLSVSISGIPLSDDDYVGFFYDANGNSACAGFAKYNSVQNSAIPVYGDDANTTAKEGFDIGEPFQVKVWQASSNQTFDVETTYTAIGGAITHTNTFAVNGISQIERLTAQASETPDWEFTITNTNHTIIIPQNLGSDIAGSPITPNDYIGFFFDDNGTERCGGFGLWNPSQTSSFAVYGDDANTTIKEGFEIGEIFQLKVWKAGELKTYEANVTFTPPNGIISHTNTFAVNGISALESIEATGESSVTTLEIQLTEGWNTISSYVLPEETDMLAVLSEISDQVVLMKDSRGRSVIPSLNINNIGNWEATQGYQIKVQSATTLRITGTKIPIQTPIQIVEGWQLIPCLQENPSDIGTQLATVASITTLVKDNAGRSYIPSLNINSIGLMQPTQGYWLKAEEAGVLIYPSNVDHTDIEKRFSTSEQIIIPTDQNSTIIVPASVAAQQLEWGDKINIYNSRGMRCGKAKYEGAAFAITVWGDDLNTKAQTEGMVVGEVLQLEVERKGESFPLSISFRKHNPTYQPQAIMMASTLEYETMEKGASIVQLFPNPVTTELNIRWSKMATTVIRILDNQGRIKRILDTTDTANGYISLTTSDLPSGIYWCQLLQGNTTQTVRFLIQH